MHVTIVIKVMWSLMKASPLNLWKYVTLKFNVAIVVRKLSFTILNALCIGCISLGLHIYALKSLQ